MRNEVRGESLPESGGPRRWPVVLGVIASIALIVVGFPLILAHMRPAARPGWVSGDDLDITLIAVRPDAGDDLYDAAGRKIAGDRALTWTGDETWRADEQKRDFLFTLPETEDEILLTGIERVMPAGATLALGGSGGGHRFRADDGGRFILLRTFPRTYLKPLLFLFSVNAPVNAVDVTIQYFHGPSLPGGYRFEGPFEHGASVEESSGQPWTLNVGAEPPSYEQPGASFSVLCDQAGLTSLHALAYTADGKRNLGRFTRQSISSAGASGEVRFDGLPLANIVAVTFERPRQRTFHNVVVSYPHLPLRTRAPYLDQMAKALGKTDLSDEQISMHYLGSAAEALKVVDVVRGKHAHQAGGTLGSHGVDFGGFDAEALERVRRAVATWTISYDHTQRVAGLAVALKAGWTEYVPRVFDLMDDEDEWVRRNAATLLRRHIGLIDGSHIEPITQAVERTSDPNVYRELMACLTHSQLHESRAALERLSKSDKPWLWYPAIRRRFREGQLREPGEFDRATATRLKLYLGHQERPGLESVADAELESLIVEVLTAEVCRMDYEAFKSAAERASEVFDKDTVTSVCVNFLKAAFEHARRSGEPLEEHGSHNLRGGICSAVRCLNAAHGIDIGGLGGDLQARYSDGEGYDSVQAGRDAIAWYETGELPGVLPEGYRAATGDLRVVWRELSDAEKSIIFLWTPSIDEPDAPRLFRLRIDNRFFALRVWREPDGALRSIEFQAGRPLAWGASQFVALSRRDLPVAIFPPDNDEPRAWTSEEELWEIHVEPADSPESVLSGMKVFEDWRQKYGPVDAPREASREAPSSTLVPAQDSEQ